MTDLERKIVGAAAQIKQRGDDWWYIWDNLCRNAGCYDALEILQPILDEIEQRQEEEDDD